MIPAQRQWIGSKFLMVAILAIVSATCQPISQARTSAVSAGQNSRCLLKLPNLQNKVVDGQDAVDAFLGGPLPSNALEHALMRGCAIHTSFAAKDIRWMKFESVVAKEADFSQGARAQYVMFSESDLTGANLSNSNFYHAVFNGRNASLRRTHLDGTILSEASLEDVDMDGADLGGATLTRAVFYPHDLPDISYIAEARDLQTLRAPFTPFALYRLARELSDRGLDSKARDVTLALQRSYQERYAYQCETGFDFGGLPFASHGIAQRVRACFYFLTRALALDATCEFGRRPGRPIGIIALLALGWTLALWFWFQVVQRPGVVLVFKSRTGDDWPIPLNRLVAKAYRSRERTRARFKIAAILTISSVFNLPFRDLDVGRWLRLLTNREFEFRLRGPVRTFLGCLSLSCFYLLALSILSFFGTPFSK
jgi:hypothetical protein